MSNTEFERLDGVTGSIQGQLDSQAGDIATNASGVSTNASNLATHVGDTANPHGVTAAQAGAIPASEKGAADGVAPLDSSGFVAHEDGGLEADVSSYDGILKVSGGATSEAVPGMDYYEPGGPDIPVADGGTGASDAAGARANLNAQEANALLSDIAGLAVSPGDTFYVNASSDIVKLTKGADGQILTLVNGYPAWINNTPSFAQLYNTYTYGNSGVNGVTFENYYNVGSGITINSDPGQGLYESLEANVDGYYFVGFNVCWDYSGTWQYSWATPHMKLRKNNADHSALPSAFWKDSHDTSILADTHQTFSGTGMIHLVSGDSITLYSYPYWGEGMHFHGQMWMQLLKED